MGQNNRQRRAAKQRQRAQRQRSRSTSNGFRPPDHRASDFGALAFGVPGVDDEVFSAGAASLLLGRSLRVLVRGGQPTFDLADFQRCAERHQQAAVDQQFDVAVDHLIAAGWTPLDLAEAVQRKTAGSALEHLLNVVAAATARHPAHLVHYQWAAQLEALGAVPPRAAGVSPSCAWGARSGMDWPAALEHLLAVLTIVHTLPRVEHVLPAPGSSPEPAWAADGIDAKVLRRVRGLLAKAESTEHPEEADALTAKAQQLMTRYSIERAVAESTQPASPTPTARRIWLENPYVDAKASLVAAVSEANNCRAVHTKAWGFVSIVGFAADLDLVELLTTSLLVQATRAMTQAGPQLTHYGTSRTRSFRQSFLLAYAGRIGERLRESADATEAGYDPGPGTSLVPVLAARRAAVDDTMAELFPTVIERRVSVSNYAGWGAGRAAADLARLDVRDSITPRAG